MIIKIKDIPGYWVSDKGEVFSSYEQISSGGHANGFTTIIHDGPIKKLKQYLRKNYFFVRLRVGGRYKNKNVHSLVLENFVGPRPANYVARHLDNCPQNNSLDNLIWDTQKNNLADRVKYKSLKCGQNHPNAKFSDDLINEIRNLELPKSPTGKIRRGILNNLCANYKMHKTTFWAIRKFKARQKTV